MKVLVLCLFAMCASTTWAQWMPETSFPPGDADGAFSVVIGDKVYMNTGPFSDEFYAYHPSTNSWEDLGELPSGLRGWAMAATLGNKLYMFGGDQGGFDPVSNCWMYDVDTRMWTQIPDFPGGDRDAGACFVADPYIYVGLGFDGAYIHADLYRFDTRDQTWTQSAFYPGGATVFPVSFTIGDVSYVATGDHGGVEGNELYAFDHETEQWIQKADFPGKARQAAFGFSANGFGYVGGGMSGFSIGYKDIWVYSPEQDKWFDQSQLTVPVGQTVWCSAFTFEGNAYVGLGVSVPEFEFGSRIYKAALLQIADVEDYASPVTVSPNPSSDIVTINYTDVPQQPDRFVIVDMQGKEVQAIEASINATTIDISHLAHGAYTVLGNSVAGNTVLKATVIVE